MIQASSKYPKACNFTTPLKTNEKHYSLGSLENGKAVLKNIARKTIR